MGHLLHENDTFLFYIHISHPNRTVSAQYYCYFVHFLSFVASLSGSYLSSFVCLLSANLLQILVEHLVYFRGFPSGPAGKESACNATDTRGTGSIPGLRRSPGEGNGNSLQYSCLENPMDQGVWQATVHGVGKSQTWQNMVHNKYTSNIKNIEINKVISSCPTLDLNLFTEYLLCARP